MASLGGRKQGGEYLDISELKRYEVFRIGDRLFYVKRSMLADCLNIGEGEFPRALSQVFRAVSTKRRLARKIAVEGIESVVLLRGQSEIIFAKYQMRNAETQRI